MGETARSSAETAAAIHDRIERSGATAVFKLDADGRVVSATGAAPWHGARSAPTVGARFVDLWPADLGPQLDDALRVGLRGEMTSLTVTAATPDGAEAHWRIEMVPIPGSNDGADFVLAACSQATADAQADGACRHDQRIAAACFDSIHAGVSAVNTDLVIVRANHTIEMMYPQAAPLVGRKCYEAFQGRSQPCEACPTLRAIATGTVQMDVVPFTTSDGVAGWLNVFASPYFDEAGEVAGVVEHVVDVTDHRQAEGRLRHVARMSAVGQLAGGVAHEFNNIMASIMGYAQLAMQSQDPAHIQRALQIAEAGCRRGKQITDGLLAFGAPGEPRRESVRIEECVDAALSLLHGDFAGAHVEVTRGDAGAIPELVVDRHQMEQVFLNLFMNARQAMPDGGQLRITFAVEACDARDPGSRCHIAVRDSGVGIPPSEVDRIFDPFFTTKGRLGDSELPGIGLGLSIAHGIVMAHGGALHVSSKPSEGTKVTVCLPLSRRSQAGLGWEVTEMNETMGYGGAVRGVRILIAEDEDPLRELLTEVLSARGHEVTAAADGQQALRALQAGDWDLVITDILMPKANGTELLRHLRDECKTTPCIVISGRGEDILQRQAIALGAATCLRKPFDIAEILSAVDRAVGKCHQDS